MSRDQTLPATDNEKKNVERCRGGPWTVTPPLSAPSDPAGPRHRLHPRL